MEDEWHNFDALNIPTDHPARDMWDTFWLKGTRRKKRGAERDAKRKEASNRLLLRTHTSPVQIRYMEQNQPPFRIIVPGRVFRHEATDASHGFQLYQLEGLMVSKDVSAANLKAFIEAFFQGLFKKEAQIRFRPSFFPFVEPGFEVDIGCLICEGRSQQNPCSVCKGSLWLELMGAGMVHPKVFGAVGYNPKHWQGIAFGMGLDRLAMMRYKIGDIRLLYAGDMRFLKQF